MEATVAPVATALPTVTEADFTWARLTSTSIETAQCWLIFMANLWADTIQGVRRHNSVKSALVDIEEAIEATKDFKRSDWRKCQEEVITLHEKFQTLLHAVQALKGNSQVHLGCNTFERRTKELGLTWQGDREGAQYVLLNYLPGVEKDVLILNWCMGEAGKTSVLPPNSLRTIPALAHTRQVEDKGQTKVQPLINIERLMCEELGIDVTHIGMKGRRGINNARNALSNHRRDLENRFKKTAEEAGFHPGEPD